MGMCPDAMDLYLIYSNNDVKKCHDTHVLMTEACLFYGKGLSTFLIVSIFYSNPGVFHQAIKVVLKQDDFFGLIHS